MRTSLPTPALGQENVALASKRCELLLDGPHPLSYLGDSALDLCVVESAEVISHQPCRRRRMRKAAAAITNKIAAILMVPLARSFTPVGSDTGVRGYRLGAGEAAGVTVNTRCPSPLAVVGVVTTG